jgi:hypothetical protein
MSEEIVKAGSQDLLELSGNLEKFLGLARAFAKSNVFPHIRNEFEALASIEAGRELGVPMVMSLTTIYPVQGRISPEAKTMLHLFKRGGGKIKIIERSDVRAEVVFSKEGEEPFTFTYTIEQARKAGYVKSGGSWEKTPEVMVYWRCISRGIMAYDPGCVLGLPSVEEMRDADVEPDTPPAVKVEPYTAPTKPEPEKPKAEAKVIEAEVVKPAANKPEPKAEPKPAGELKARALAMMDTLYTKHNVVDIYPRVAARVAALHGLKSMEGTEVDEKMTEADAEQILPILEKYIMSPAKAKKGPAPAKTPEPKPEETKA